MAGSDKSALEGFTVAIFGSARIKQGSEIYWEIYELARLIGEAGMNIVTGGGPGLMNAASEGHKAGRRNSEAKAIGLRIKLPFKEVESSHLDIKKEFDRFSHRLDEFMSIANAVVVAPGGVGTLLELAYTWQLLQVKHISNIPVILLGEMWLDFLEWIKKWPLKHGLMDPEDVALLHLAKNIQEALRIIMETYQKYVNAKSS
ncbi:MAG: LOG family protein [Candidatus Bathyarchaeota archaeon]|nr:LOG family protein [Candidatus Bathyarchaeota archaeon]